MLRIAHRGLNKFALQNTLPAFEHAVQQGMDGIELDVQLAKCKTPMVFHDDTLGDLFGEPGAIRDYTADELALFRSPLSDRFDVDPDTMLIPRLRQVLDVFPMSSSFTVNVELKSPTPEFESVTPSTAAVLSEYRGMNFLVSSFNPIELVRFTRLRDDVPIALLYGPETPYGLNTAWPRRILQRIRLDALHPHFELVSRDMVARAHKEGLQVNVWTVNDRGWGRWLNDIGVDALISDDPRVAFPMQSD